MRRIMNGTRPVNNVDAHGECRPARTGRLRGIINKHVVAGIAAVVQVLMLVVALPYPAFLDHGIVHTAMAVLPLAATALRIAFAIRRRRHHRQPRTDESTNH